MKRGETVEKESSNGKDSADDRSLTSSLDRQKSDGKLTLPPCLKLSSRNFMSTREKKLAKRSIEEKFGKMPRKRKDQKLKVSFAPLAHFCIYDKEVLAFEDLTEWKSSAEVFLLTGHRLKNFEFTFLTLHEPNGVELNPEMFECTEEEFQRAVEPLPRNIFSNPEKALPFWKDIMRQGSPILAGLEDDDSALTRVTLKYGKLPGVLPLLPEFASAKLEEPERMNLLRGRISSLKRTVDQQLEMCISNYGLGLKASQMIADCTFPVSDYSGNVYELKCLDEETKGRDEARDLEELLFKFRTPSSNFKETFTKISEMISVERDKALFQDDLFVALTENFVRLRMVNFQLDKELSFRTRIMKLFGSPCFNPETASYAANIGAAMEMVRKFMSVLEREAMLINEVDEMLKNGMKLGHEKGITSVLPFEMFGKVLVNGNKDGKVVMRQDLFVGNHFKTEIDDAETPLNKLNLDVDLSNVPMKIQRDAWKNAKEKTVDLNGEEATRIFKQWRTDVKNQKPITLPVKICLPPDFFNLYLFMRSPTRSWAAQKMEFTKTYISVINSGMTHAILNGSEELMNFFLDYKIPLSVEEFSLFHGEASFAFGAVPEQAPSMFIVDRIKRNRFIRAFQQKFQYVYKALQGTKPKNPLELTKVPVRLTPINVALNVIARADLQVSRNNKNCEPNCPGHRGALLGMLIRQGNVRLVDVLLEHGVNVNSILCKGSVKNLRWYEIKKKEQAEVVDDLLKATSSNSGDGSEKESDSKEGSKNTKTNLPEDEPTKKEDSKKPKKKKESAVQLSKQEKQDLAEEDCSRFLNNRAVFLVSEYQKQTPLAVAVDAIVSAPSKDDSEDIIADDRLKIFNTLLYRGADVMAADAVALRACLPAVCMLAKEARRRCIRETKKDENESVKRSSSVKTISTLALESSDPENLHKIRLVENSVAVFRKISSRAVKSINKKNKKAAKRFKGHFANIFVRTILVHEALKQEQWDVVRFLCPWKIDPVATASNLTSNRGMKRYDAAVKLLDKATAEVLKKTIRLLMLEIYNPHVASCMKQWNAIFFLLREYNIVLNNFMMKDLVSLLMEDFSRTVMLKPGELQAMQRVLSLKQVLWYLQLDNYPLHAERLLDSMTYSKPSSRSSILARYPKLSNLRKALFVHTLTNGMDQVSELLKPGIVTKSYSDSRYMKAMVFHVLLKKQQLEAFESLNSFLVECRENNSQNSGEDMFIRGLYRNVLDLCLMNNCSPDLTSYDVTAAEMLLDFDQSLLPSQKAFVDFLNRCLSVKTRLIPSERIVLKKWKARTKKGESELVTDLSRFMLLSKLLKLDEMVVEGLLSEVLKTPFARGEQKRLMFCGPAFRSIWEACEARFPEEARTLGEQKRIKEAFTQMDEGFGTYTFNDKSRSYKITLDETKVKKASEKKIETYLESYPVFESIVRGFRKSKREEPEIII